MASVASQLIEEVTAHVQSDSLKDVREKCADGTYFPNNLSKLWSMLHETQDGLIQPFDPQISPKTCCFIL